MTFRSRALAAALTAFSLTAFGPCDRAPFAPQGLDDAGVLSFTYTGDEAGRYFALGEPDSLSGSVPMGDEFAAAVHHRLGAEPLGTAVTSTARARGRLTDHAHVQFPGALEARTYTYGSCSRMPFCPLVNLVFDVDREIDGGGAQARYYSMESGSITVLSVADGRVRGTFAGTFVRYASDGATTRITVTEGAFDAPVRDWDASGG